MQASILKCYGHVTFGFLKEVWFIKLHGGKVVLLSLILVIKIFVFKLKIVGREDAQTEFGTVDLLCIICGGGLKAYVDCLPHTYSYTCL
jgi:hypothetical protein